MDGKRKNQIRRIGKLFFFLYIAALAYFLFFSERYGRVAGDEYRYNLELFAEIKRYIRYRDLFTTESFVVNLIGNVVAFMPFGFFIPIVTRKKNFFYTLLMTFEFTLCIEFLQLVTKVGIFDVDDLFLNTCGGILGFICYRIGYRFFRMLFERKDCVYVQKKKENCN